MILILVLLFILGCAVGSFLNVVIDRTTRGETILGRSYCDYCRATLGTLDLVPIISFVTLGAKCRYCKKPLSIQYPLVEAVTGFLFVLSYLNLVNAGVVSFGYLAYYLFIVCIAIVVASVDVKFSLIPTTFVFLGSLVSLFFNYFNLPTSDFIGHVIAAFIASIFFAIIVIATRGRGMGEGDIVLAFFMGMVLGFREVTLAIFLAFFVGAVVSLFLILLGKKKFGQTVPFAPFLILGFLTSLFWAKPIIDWYLMVY